VILLIIAIIISASILVYLATTINQPQEKPQAPLQEASKIQPLAQGAPAQKLEFESKMLTESADASKADEAKTLDELPEAATQEQPQQERQKADAAVSMPEESQGQSTVTARQTPTPRELRELKGKGIILY